MNKKESQPPTAGLLVIGYGNELRRDDGVGPKVAAAVAKMNLPGVRIHICHQLTPELADPISHSSRVIFVDAATLASKEVQTLKLKPDETVNVMAHAANPHSLLALAHEVFGYCPPAWWLTIPVEDFGFGDELSPVARRGFNVADEKICSIAAQAA